MNGSAAGRTSGVTVVPGDTIDAIVTAADAMRAAMIIIGVPSNAGRKQQLHGSVTPGLLRHARCPVLVVPSPSG